MGWDSLAKGYSGLGWAGLAWVGLEFRCAYHGLVIARDGLGKPLPGLS